MNYGEFINELLKECRPPAYGKGSGEKPDMEWINDLCREHPTFIVPLLMMIKRYGDTLDQATLTQLQNAAVLNCADRVALADFIDPTGAGWATFYPPMKPREITTEETIDDFLQTFGHASTPEEDALLEKLIFNPVAPDYFSGTDQPYDPTDPLALPPELAPKEKEEKPKEASETPAPNHAKMPDETDAVQERHSDKKEKAATQTPPDESLLMESLAKIFIKQRRYERAFEIISKLSLKYPEKSVYFADQLRFLQKLIINQQYKTK